MKTSVILAFLIPMASSYGASILSATSTTLYQSAANNPMQLGNSYSNLFVAGAYSKNYAMVTIAYWDVSTLTTDQLQNSSFSLGVMLTSVSSQPANLNIDYLGTFGDTASSSSRYLAPSERTFPDVLTSSVAPGSHVFDVSGISEGPFTSRYAAFRFYQTGYLSGDSTTREYEFSSNLESSQLVVTAIPEPGTSTLYGAAMIVASIGSFRRTRRSGGI
ncbi:MAG: hypothetical protein V4584_07330 [Verrucomicrobiota bacterium]